MPVISLVLTSPLASIDLPSESGEQPSNLSLHDLSAHKVYLAPCITTEDGELLPRHFTMTSIVTSRLPIFCGTICIHQRRTLPVRKYGALCCPDFPLTVQDRKRQADLLSTNLRIYSTISFETRFPLLVFRTIVYTPGDNSVVSICA